MSLSFSFFLYVCLSRSLSLLPRLPTDEVATTTTPIEGRGWEAGRGAGMAARLGRRSPLHTPALSDEACRPCGLGLRVQVSNTQRQRGQVTCPANGRTDGRMSERKRSSLHDPLQGLGLLCGFRERREGEVLNALGHFRLPSTLSNCAHRNPLKQELDPFFAICSVVCTGSQGGNQKDG